MRCVYVDWWKEHSQSQLSQMRGGEPRVCESATSAGPKHFSATGPVSKYLGTWCVSEWGSEIR